MNGEPFNSKSGDDTYSELEKYRKALSSTKNSKFDKKKMYLELMKKLEEEDDTLKKRSSVKNLHKRSLSKS
jgi:hypothetical protein